MVRDWSKIWNLVLLSRKYWTFFCLSGFIWLLDAKRAKCMWTRGIFRRWFRRRFLFEGYAACKFLELESLLSNGQLRCITILA